MGLKHAPEEYVDAESAPFLTDGTGAKKPYYVADLIEDLQRLPDKNIPAFWKYQRITGVEQVVEHEKHIVILK